MTETSIPHEMVKNIKRSMNDIRTQRRASVPAVGVVRVTNSTHEWIAERERLEQAATEGPWCATFGPRELARVWTDSPDDAEALATITGFTRQADGAPDAEFIADARTSLPTAVASLKAVLELHRPVEVEPSDTICGECSFQLPNGRYLGKIVEWPCPTVSAVEAGR